MTEVSEIKPDETYNVKLKSGVTVNIKSNTFSGVLQSVVVQRGSWGIFKINGVNCIGIIHDLQIRAQYKLTGKFEENKKYNTWDFKFTEYECTIDKTAGLRDYLVREAPNIGPQVAVKLVNVFGNDTIKVLASNPGQIADTIQGLSIDRAMALQVWAKGELSNARIKEKLYEIGITKGQVDKLIKAYGNNAEQRLKEDCFSLTEIHGFGFITAAKIANLIGVPKTDKGRIKAGVIYSLDCLLDRGGHACLESSELVRESCALLELSQEHINPIIKQMIQDGDLVTEETDFKQFCLEKGIEQ